MPVIGDHLKDLHTRLLKACDISDAVEPYSGQDSLDASLAPLLLMKEFNDEANKVWGQVFKTVMDTKKPVPVTFQNEDGSKITEQIVGAEVKYGKRFSDPIIRYRAIEGQESVLKTMSVFSIDTIGSNPDP
ncbi:MAG: hypothetical protein K9G62_01300 [Alphaproteobacteria bacterium]|nr:hypothetical protein [Alphaproteobacteria bacterium]